jgi:hypothetical protein
VEFDSAVIPYVVLRDCCYNMFLNVHVPTEDIVMLKTLTEKCHLEELDVG